MPPEYEETLRGWKKTEGGMLIVEGRKSCEITEEDMKRYPGGLDLTTEKPKQEIRIIDGVFHGPYRTGRGGFSQRARAMPTSQARPRVISVIASSLLRYWGPLESILCRREAQVAWMRYWSR